MMKHLAILAAVFATTVAPGVAGAPEPGWTDTAVSATAGGAGQAVRFAQQADCSSAGQQAAAQTGGEVLSVRTSQQGGQTVCIVTVLIPGEDGGRPRRETVVIHP